VQLRSEAASHGVADLDAAKAELELAEKGSAATPLSEKVRELPCPTILCPSRPTLFCLPCSAPCPTLPCPHVTCPALALPPLHMQAQYVQCLMLLQGKGMIQKHKAALTLVLRGSVGTQVHAKGSDDQLRQRLEKKKNALAFLLGISEGGRCCFGVWGGVKPV
jgi:hypothetical protein